MEAPGYFLPAEEHDGYEGALHEEGEHALDGQGRAKDVANHPGIVAPVGTELELKDDTCRHTHGEVDAEELLPETGYLFPKALPVR